MNIISFLIGGFIAYWLYWSIKRKGFYWLVKVLLLVGSFFLLFISLVSYQHELNLLLRFFYGNKVVVKAICFVWYLIFAHSIQKHIISPIIFVLDKKIEKRIGIDPYR